MTSFSQTAIVLFFLSVGTPTAIAAPQSPNVPWITQEDGEYFLTAFLDAMPDELQQDGRNDLELLLEDFLSLIPKNPGRLSLARLQAINMAFAAIIASIVVSEGSGSTEQKMEVVREALIEAFLATSGDPNLALIREIITLIKIFSEDQDYNDIDQNFPQQEYPEFIPQVGSIGEYETSGFVTAQQASTGASQSSSTVSTTTSSTQTYSGQTASSSSLTSTATATSSEASSLFTQYLTSLVLQNPDFGRQYNTIASSGIASIYASTYAEAVANSNGQSSIASTIASAVSQATGGISAVAGYYDFVQAYASAVARVLTTGGELNVGNANTLANEYGNSLLTAVSSASTFSASSASTSSASSTSTSSASSATLATSTSASASSQGSVLQTSSAALGASGANYGGLSLGVESQFSPAFGAGGWPTNFDFLTPFPGIPAVPPPPKLSPYSPLISDLLQSPSGLTSPAANQRIASLLPVLTLAVGNGFNVPLFSSAVSSLASQISQSTGFSSSQIRLEVILEIITALLNILSSAQVGVVSTDSQAAAIYSAVQSVFNSINA